MADYNVIVLTVGIAFVTQVAMRLGHGVRQGPNKAPVVFVTTGYLVRLLANHPDALKHHTHLIIDEVGFFLLIIFFVALVTRIFRSFGGLSIYTVIIFDHKDAPTARSWSREHVLFFLCCSAIYLSRILVSCVIVPCPPAQVSLSPLPPPFGRSFFSVL